MSRARGALLALATLLGACLPAEAQLTDHAVRLQRLRSTPVGALPPMALPMPASRDNNYWTVKLQLGQQRGPSGEARTIGGGLDFQWRGGSSFGATVAQRGTACEDGAPGCESHLMFGFRARLNFITAGPTIAALVGDYTATSTLGTEIGFGYAHRVLPDVHACNLDLGAPLAVAMFRPVRVSLFLKPGIVVDYRCSGGGPSTGVSFLGGTGVALQQLGVRGLDLHVGVHRIFRRGAGYALGATLSYTRIP